ncbi:cytochrome b, partial [Paracoccus shandongensis]|uniref:cytochrome b n=1 Tax=Paracoccus shandongensis TaxID=2816048 RepID=UPI001A905A74
MPRNTPRRYGGIARTLHWLTALIIGGNIALGLAANRLPLEAIDAKVRLFSLHKTLGIAAFAVAGIRILWAVSQPRPLPVHPERRLETFLAESVHWILYAALLLVPLSGWIEHAATEGYAPILWPLGQGLPLVPKSPHLAETMASVHQTFAWLLIGAVALHVAGALKHALIDRDGVLARMLRGRPAGPATARRHRTPALAAIAVFAAGTAL